VTYEAEPDGVGINAMIWNKKRFMQ